MQENHKILVVDDDMRLRALLERYLTEQGFQVRSVANAEQMDRLLTRESFHLMVLDLMLPGEDGLSICRRLRSQSNPMPIIMVTAKGEEVDRIVGLEIGADDYVVKPFDPRELVARVRSVLRRNRTAVPAVAPEPLAQPDVRFIFSGWTFDTATRELRNPADEVVPLSTAEFHLLRALVENANRVLSRSQLLDLTQRSETVTFDRSIDSQVSRLRKKLEPDPRRPGMLKTVRGDGYLLATRVTLEH